MNKKVTKTPKKTAVCVDKVEAQRDTWFKQTPKKTAVCACKVGDSKKEQQSVNCAAKATPIKASLESVIANPTILKKPNTPQITHHWDHIY
ncbi:hypothetical protein [Candidatus Avelusimicrobium stercoris]|uniref:hypothetical protein n=1 Tax=Candidatus Avelusimicrobium stercoris TaxID=1947924 RepID=UPI003D09D656